MERKYLRSLAASAALILGSAAAAGAGQAALTSAWTDQTIVVDGLSKDWQGIPLTDWKKDGVSYAFRNDGETLYALLVIKDPKYRSTIEATGVTLYFDAKGAKSKDYGILFKKVRLDPEAYIAHLEKQGPVSEEDKAELRKKAGFYLYHHQVLDHKGKPVEAVSEALARPAVFKYAPDGPAVVYEFSVPLLRGSDLAAGVGAGPGAPVAVGFEWGGQTEEMKKAAAKKQREQANFANEEADRGGDPQIVRSTGSGPTPKKYSFWASLALAKSGS
jgi:hypothetical protein